MTKYCQDCGTPSASATAKFCQSCGEPFVKTAAKTKTLSSQASVTLDEGEDFSPVVVVPDLEEIEVSISADAENSEKFGTSFTFSPDGKVQPIKFRGRTKTL